MYLEVSVGEAIDKYCILELKYSRIQDQFKLSQIKKEIDALKECKTILEKLNSVYYRMLFYVNEQIWDMTDKIKSMTPNDSEFSNISYQIFEFNQKRFRLKKVINELTTSNIQEQKSYTNSECTIYIKDENTFFSHLTHINYLSIQYDTISFKIDNMNINIIKKIYNTSNYAYNYIINNIINIEDVKIPIDIIHIFKFQPIIYKASGLLGDFFQSLSVAYEFYRETGRKAILYISDNPCAFRYPIEKTFNDLKQLILEQPYIESFDIWNNQHFDIDLDIWRSSPYLYRADWHTIYKKTYNINWGMNPWIFLKNNSEFNNKIVVCMSLNRPPPNIHILHQIKNRGDNMIFLCETDDEYTNFKKLIDLDIPLIKVNSLYEKAIAIRSSKYFVGNLTASLAIANGCNVPRLGLLSGSIDDTHNRTYIWPNYGFT